jgi:hypothetical protein
VKFLKKLLPCPLVKSGKKSKTNVNLKKVNIVTNLRLEILKSKNFIER